VAIDRQAIEARIAELRADDAAMTDGPWNPGEDPDDGEVWDEIKLVVHRIGRAPIAANATGIARTRNSLASTAEMLSGLLVEVARLETAKHPLDRKCKCPACGRMSRITTAGCDHCDLEDK
jgi:hypothetical protein